MAIDAVVLPHYFTLMVCDAGRTRTCKGLTTVSCGASLPVGTHRVRSGADLGAAPI